MENDIDILIADDDETIRMYLCRLLTVICALEGLGVSVYEAKDGLEAIKIIRILREKLSFVITDMDMPKEDGNAVAKSAFSYGIPVILTTATPALIKEEVLLNSHATVDKPIDMQELKNAVMTLLFHMSLNAS